MAENNNVMDKFQMENPYVQITWKTRVADYPSRRRLSILESGGHSLPEAIIVDVERWDGDHTTGGSVRESGTAINANNFNILEGRIGTGFNAITGYINEKAEAKFEYLDNQNTEVHTKLEEVDKKLEEVDKIKNIENTINNDLIPNTLYTKEDIPLQKTICAGIIERVNTGVFYLKFFIPYNKSGINLDENKISIEGSMQIYAPNGKLTNSSIAINNIEQQDKEYSTLPLGLYVFIILRDILPGDLNDTNCSIIFDNNSYLKFDIETEEEGQ